MFKEIQIPPLGWSALPQLDVYRPDVFQVGGHRGFRVVSPLMTPDWWEEYERIEAELAPYSDAYAATDYRDRQQFESSLPYREQEAALHTLWEDVRVRSLAFPVEGEMWTRAKGRGIVKLVAWMYQEKFWQADDDISAEDLKALVDRKYQKRRNEIDRAKAAVAADASVTSRQAIADDVKIFVWQRDQGRCVRCGSNENLEFDHVIPVVMGGANTARNLQILCEPCNRAKGGNLV